MRTIIRNIEKTFLFLFSSMLYDNSMITQNDWNEKTSSIKPRSEKINVIFMPKTQHIKL